METLERCRTCGASLSPDIDWCGQCYTPVSSAEEREDDVIVVPEAAALVPDRRPAGRAGVAWERALHTRNGGLNVELLVAR